jgi:hypothetical protein
MALASALAGAGPQAHAATPDSANTAAKVDFNTTWVLNW